MKRKSQERIELDELNHVKPYPSQDVLTAATILYSFTNPDCLKNWGKKNVVPPLIPFKEKQDIPYTCFEVMKREITKKAENKYFVSTTKALKRSDVDYGQGRLMVPKPFVLEEIIPLLKNTEILKDGIKVNVYNSELKKFKIVFKCWSDEKAIVLSSGWNEFHSYNGLKPDVTVHIWAFRHAISKELCFAIFS